MGKKAFGIALDNAVAVAGTTLKGRLWVDLDKESNGSEVVLTLKGIEKSVIEYTLEENDDRDNSVTASRVTRFATSSRNLINYNLPINNQHAFIVGGKIAPGKYELPFELDLPSILPSSMKETYHDGSYCEVTYELKGEIKGSGFFSNYKSNQFVQVSAKPLDRAAMPYAVPPVTEVINFFCCMNKGSISFAAKIDDTKLDKGETANVHLACRNNSTSAIKKIEAKVMQECEWKAEHHRKQNVKTLQKIDFTGISDLSMPSGGSDIPDPNLHQTLLKELQDGKRSQPLTMPRTALPTYAGQLFTVKHYVLLTLQTGKCATNPELRIPVQVGEVPLIGGGGQPPPSNAASEPVPDDFAGTSTSVPIDSTPEVTLGGKQEGTQAATATTADKSIPGLLSLMEDSVQDLSMVQDCAKDAAWQSVLASCSASDYGKIIKSVGSDFEQPSVAETLAPIISNFTCAHVVAALQSTAEWSRGSVTEKLLPFCKDLSTNYQSIKNELSDWEKMTTETAFTNAMK